MNDFLDSWKLMMTVLSPLLLLIGIGRRLAYVSRRNGMKELKDRYDYMTSMEVKAVQFYWYMIALAAFLFLNTLFTEDLKKLSTSAGVWFAGRLFLAALIGAMVALVSREIINNQFVGNLEARLDTLRKQPRACNDCKSEGRQSMMRRLSEEEEDEYLEAHQIAEEADTTSQHSADYDVWLCEFHTGVLENKVIKHKRVEKYYNYQHARKCKKCDGFTLRPTREEVTHQPTPWQTGLLVRHYKCTNCSHREREAIELSRLQHITAGNPNAPTEVH